MRKEFVSNSEDDTYYLGKKLASYFTDGAFFALYGDLGSGKSVFARGVGAYLGVNNIASPTFTIMQRYETTPVFYHIDAYRLSGADELYDVGFEECLRGGAIVVLEWADIVSCALPVSRVDIHFSGSGTDPRKIVMESDNLVLTEEQLSSL